MQGQSPDQNQSILFNDLSVLLNPVDSGNSCRLNSGNSCRVLPPAA